MWFSKNSKGMRKGNNKSFYELMFLDKYSDFYVFIFGKMIL